MVLLVVLKLAKLELRIVYLLDINEVVNKYLVYNLLLKGLESRDIFRVLVAIIEGLLKCFKLVAIAALLGVGIVRNLLEDFETT